VLLLAARPRRTREREALASLRQAPEVTRIEIPSLGPAGVAALVRAQTPAATEDLCAACAQVTEGNPFYLTELLLALDDGPPGASRGTPDRVYELGASAITRAALFRLVELGPKAATVAESLAVFGGRAPLPWVAELAGLPLATAAEVADALAAEALITSGTELDFRHPLIRQSIYKDIPPAKRALIHARAACLLNERDAGAEMVSAHLLLAPPSGEEWTVRALRAAARRASSHGEPATAARYLQCALAQGLTEATLEQVRLELGVAQTAAGLPGAAKHLGRVLATQTNPQDRVEVARLLARALASEGQQTAAAEVLERALDSLEGTCTAQRNNVLADYLALAAFHPELRQRSFTRAEPVLDMPPDASTPESRALLAALAMRSGQGWQPNQETICLAQRAWCSGALLTDEGPEGAGWLMTVWAAELAEDHHLTTDICTAVLHAARATGAVSAHASASYFRGVASHARGHLIDAQADAEQAINVGETEWHPYLVPSLVLRANALIDRAELVEAESTLVRAAAIGGNGMLEVPWTAHAKGRLALASHRPAVAIDLFLQAGTYLTDTLHAEHTVLPWRADAARAAMLLGNKVLARELIDAELTAAEHKQARAGRGRALRLLGILTGMPAGLDLLIEATEILGSTDAELDHAGALTDLGGALRRCGRRTGAREPLLDALAITQRLEAHQLTRRIRDELAAAGIRARISTKPTGSLTPSERRVADLASRGLTNKEIAQYLFITPKTVEYHLRHVYQSLNIPGRRHLASALTTTTSHT
jgi:DNA-binding CsgD family transcriptional regulator